MQSVCASGALCSGMLLFGLHRLIIGRMNGKAGVQTHRAQVFRQSLPQLPQASTISGPLLPAPGVFIGLCQRKA